MVSHKSSINKAVQDALEAENDRDEWVASIRAIPHDSSEPLVESTMDLAPLKPESLSALRKLGKYRPPKDGWPMRRRAAVMVSVFGGRHGDLYVILSKRSKDLRTHPGDVALPGGKMEPSDLSLEYTARREAFEEVGLPINTESVRYLCTLRPFLSRVNILVTPIVCFILDPTIPPEINRDEVESIFSHPLESFLFNTPREPVLHSLDPEVQKGRRPYRMCYDVPWLHGKPYRFHRFESKRDPIIGFTADILIEVARIAYRKPEFERKSPDQLTKRRLVELAFAELPEFQENHKKKDKAKL